MDEQPQVKAGSLADDVLDELCRARITLSAVSLASDLWDRGRLRKLGDPFGLVCWTLDDLNKAGCVVYREGYNQVPVEIRVTPLGYKVAGFPIQAHRVGSHYMRRVRPEQDGARAHPGDPTDFRNQLLTSIGGDVEKMPIAKHMTCYPDHDHRRQWIEVLQLRADRGAPIPIEERNQMASRTAAAEHQAELDRIAATVPTAVVPRFEVELPIGDDPYDPLLDYPITRAAIEEDDTKYEPIRRAAAILRNSGSKDLADLVEQEANIDYTPLLQEAMELGRKLRDWKDRQ